jgi:hypothetical protein
MTISASPFCDRLQLDPEPLRAAQHVRRQHDGARVGKRLDGFLGDALDTRPAGDRWSSVPHSGQASGTGSCGRNDGTAIAAKPVLDQPARTVRALEPVAADPAQRQRRIAAPVEEQKRLLLALQRLATAFSNSGDRNLPRAGGVRRMSTSREIRQRRLGDSAVTARGGSALLGVDRVSTDGVALDRIAGNPPIWPAPPPCRERCRRPGLPACRRGRAPHRR